MSPTLHISEPYLITARLLPGVKIGDGYVSIETHPRGPDGRTRYRYHIDTPSLEHTGDDLQSGFQGGDYQDGMESLLSFMDAAAERSDETAADLFPLPVVEWIRQHSDEIAYMLSDLEGEEP